jgi:predicted acylesterase/phospholipase RssA
MEKTPEPFYVGLCLAGAVSAGAYTAGVMDYLIEALDTWESHRDDSGTPQHRVKIPVIGGASAGGMTGILTASAINNPIVPMRKLDTLNPFRRYPENKFWHTWVDLKEDDMFPLMLDTDDIKHGEIHALFNSSFIKDIAERIIKVDSNQWIERPYFDNNLKVFTTLTNLRGLSFDIDFLGSGLNRDKYCVTRYNDYACFKLNSLVYEGDGWIPLDFRSGTSGKLASHAAMATGAFPVGLQSRRVTRESRYVNDNPWLKDLTLLNPVLAANYDSLNVDGGMINNEPFEKVRDVLIEITGQSNHSVYNDYDQFTSTVLMVDPFPSEPPVYNNSNLLFHVMGSTLSALVGQVRIKPENLVEAVKSNLAGQFLISPSRAVPQRDGRLKEEMGSNAIACGAFGGFSGFFNKEFRIHDYFLGRANCEKFLRDHFTVPASSRNLVTKGYANLSEEQRKKYYSHSTGDVSLPIIPVLVPRSDHKYLPVFDCGMDWPVVKEHAIDRFKRNTQRRVYALIMNLTKYKWWMRAFLSIGAWAVLKRRLAKVALTLIKQSLYDHALLDSSRFKLSKRKSGVMDPMPDKDTIVHWLLKVAESTASHQACIITEDCQDAFQNGISSLLKDEAVILAFRNAETKNSAYNNMRKFVLQMTVEAKRKNTNALTAEIFNQAKSDLCPLFPIC